MKILDTNLLTIGEDLRKARLSKNFSRKQLSIKARVNINTVDNYEYFRRLPRLDVLASVAQALDIDEIRIDTRKGGGRYGA